MFCFYIKNRKYGNSEYEEDKLDRQEIEERRPVGDFQE
jgi:hypothetical protein